MAIFRSHAGYLATLVVLLTSTNLAAAADTHEHEHEHYAKQEAHVHGVAELTMVLENNTLELNLESPAANIVGFEHRASSQEQKTAVEEAERILESPTILFDFIGTDCQVSRSMVDISAVEGRHHDAADHDDDHEHESEHHDDEQHQTHSEINANYQFTCKQGSQLTTVSFDILDQFSAIEALHVQWITDAGQGATELSGNSKIVELR